MQPSQWPQWKLERNFNFYINDKFLNWNIIDNTYKWLLCASWIHDIDTVFIFLNIQLDMIIFVKFTPLLYRSVELEFGWASFIDSFALGMYMKQLHVQFVWKEIWKYLIINQIFYWFLCLVFVSYILCYKQNSSSFLILNKFASTFGQWESLPHWHNINKFLLLVNSWMSFNMRPNRKTILLNGTNIIAIILCRAGVSCFEKFLIFFEWVSDSDDY